MSKTKTVKVRKSFLPENLIESQEFFQGGEVTIVKARVVIHRFPGRSAKDSNKGDKYDKLFDGAPFVAFWFHVADPEFENDYSKPTQFYSMGSANFWRPSNDGFTPLEVDLDQSWLDADTTQQVLESEGLYFCEVDEYGNAVEGPDGEFLDPDYELKSKGSTNSKSLFGQFAMLSIKEGGFDREVIKKHTGPTGTSMACWEGARVMLDKVPQSDGKINPKTDEPYSVMAITHVFEYGIDVSQYQGGDIVDKSGDGSGGNVDTFEIQEQLQAKIVEVLTKQGGTMNQTQAIMEAGKFGEDVEHTIPLVAEDSDWLNSYDRPWTYDKESKTLTTKG